MELNTQNIITNAFMIILYPILSINIVKHFTKDMPNEISSQRQFFYLIVLSIMGLVGGQIVNDTIMTGLNIGAIITLLLAIYNYWKVIDDKLKIMAIGSIILVVIIITTNKDFNINLKLKDLFGETGDISNIRERNIRNIILGSVKRVAPGEKYVSIASLNSQSEPTFSSLMDAIKRQ